MTPRLLELLAEHGGSIVNYATMFLLGVFVVANVGCTSTLGRQSTVSGTSADERASVTRKLELHTTRKLELDDVVFMYMPSDLQALEDYGATFIAWGGAHRSVQVKQLRDMGIHPTGSIWCLTAGARTLHTNPDVREAVCRDISGEPIKVPWLDDSGNVHEGTPAWFGCTNNPAFRAHVRKAVCDSMAGGAGGLHVDDHLGTAGSINYGGCFCDWCMKLFTEHLQKVDSPQLRAEAGVDSFDGFDYRTIVRRHATTVDEYRLVMNDIPLIQEYIDLQLRTAAEHTVQLGKLAAEIVKQPITLSANAGVHWDFHMVVTPHLTHIVGEVPFYPWSGVGNLGVAVKTYRLAEALGKPIAATAYGSNWAYVKETGCENLVRLWIALSYACGQRLMAPHRMWCHSADKGTHWYDGPTDAYAPLYQFVRRDSELFRGMQTAGPLAIPPGTPREVDTDAKRRRLIDTLGEARPLTAADGKVWLFPRAGRDTAVLHVLNLDYDAGNDSFTPQLDLAVRVDEKLFGKPFRRATLHSFDTEPREVKLEREDGVFKMTLPELQLWGVVKLEL